MTGYQPLGEFDFTADAPFSVHLADNTGEAYISTAKIAIMFDAVRVTPSDGTGDGSGSDGGGNGDDDSMGSGCSASGSGSPFALLLALGALLRRRRR
jgi:uncharacterized protein (TIGR03382 family)